MVLCRISRVFYLICLNKLQISQASSGTLEDIRGRGEEKSRSIQATKGISLLLDDLYLKDEPIMFKAKSNPDADFGGLKGQIVCVSHARPNVNLDFIDSDDEWSSSPEGLSLQPGLYRLQVTTAKTGEEAPNPVNDLFEIADFNN